MCVCVCSSCSVKRKEFHLVRAPCTDICVCARVLCSCGTHHYIMLVEEEEQRQMGISFLLKPVEIRDKETEADGLQLS